MNVLWVYLINFYSKLFCDFGTKDGALLINYKLSKMKKILIALISLLACGLAQGQTNSYTILGTAPDGEVYSAQVEEMAKQKTSFKDTLDGALDVSDWLIHKHGFIPWPMIVTEQALGGFGMGFSTIFIDPVEPRTVKGKVYPRSPNMYMAGGFYTLNGTWAVGGGASGNIKRWNARYQLFAGYVNLNMDFYHTFPNLGEEGFEFNIKGIPIYAAFIKELWNPRFTLGLNYMYAHATVSLKHSDLPMPDWITSKELKSNVARLGLKFEYDSRDNTFTPNKGFMGYINGLWSNPVVGSDYKYGQFFASAFWYAPYGGHAPWGSRRFVSGLRTDIEQQVSDAPFYLKPYIDLRGVPVNKYQGKSVLVLENEHRWDFTRRWSAVAFGGVGKAFDDYSKFGDAPWVYNYGVGGRYLIARLLKLRIGVDLAMGRDGFSYYLTFGSAWNRN